MFEKLHLNCISSSQKLGCISVAALIPNSMELLYRHLITRLCNLIGLMAVVCRHFNYAEAVSHSQEAFICTANAFHQATASYVNCTFKLNYTNYTRDLNMECVKNNVDEVMGISTYGGKTPLHPHSMNRTRKQILQMSSPTLMCVSNIPVNIRTEVDERTDLAHFTDISRSRIFNLSVNETQYILNVRLLQFKNYLNLFFGELKYQVFSTQVPINKINIFISGSITDNDYIKGCFHPRIAYCGSTICRHDVSLTDLLAKTFVEIPIPSLMVAPFIRKEICKFESNISRCRGTVTNPPTICFPVQQLKIKLEKRNKSVTFNGSVYRKKVPFHRISEAINLKSDNLKIIELDKISAEDMDNLAKSFENQTDKPFVVPKDYPVRFDELEYFINYLSSNAKNNCVRHHRLSFDQLQFALQLLGVKEIVIGRKEDLSFTPLVGFKIRSQLLLDYGPGNYTVRFIRASCSVVFPISIDISPHPYGRNQFVQHRGYDFFTGAVASKQPFTFSCPSRAEHTSFLLSQGGHSFNTTRVIHHKNLSKRHGFKSFSLAYVYLPENFQRLTLSCTTPKRHSWTQPNNIFAWRLRYFPELDRFQCYGNDVNLNHWKCRNRIQCETVAFSCIQNVTNEGFLPDGSPLFTDPLRKDGSRLFDKGVAFKSFCMDTLLERNVERCQQPSWRVVLASHESCVATKPSQMGILQCISRSAPLYESQLIYFQGFDGILYVNDDMKGPPPKEAVLKLTTTSNQNIFYTKAKYTFFCEAHSFFYDGGIRWLLKYQNGTTRKPPNENVNEGHNSNDTISNSKSELTLVVQEQDASLEEVFCIAPYVINLNFSNVSITVKITASTPPIITTLSADIGFIKDVKDQSLTCAVSGRPLPKISWKHNNEDIQEPILILEGNTLLFPTYDFNLSGEYICTATNVAGNDTKVFFVQEKKTWNNTLVIGLVILILIIVSILFLIFLTNERIKKYREMKEVINLLNGRENSSNSANEVDGDAYQTHFLFDTKYDLMRNTFIIDQNILLGKGEFGEVYHGLLRGRNEAVAFKTACPNAGFQHLKALVSEAKILMYIGPHDHLVILLGVYRQEIKSGILYVAIEYCALGSLESFLRNHHWCFKFNLDGKILNTTTNYLSQDEAIVKGGSNKRTEEELRKSLCTVQNLLVWSEQIAIAMEYLGTKNVIHSDLASRNVLLTSQGTAKVTDFGLSRRTYNYSEYIKTAKDPLPWRWLAIESLRTNTFSSKSDVWAYGILLWEIFSLGDIPYPGMSPTLEFVQELENGFRNCKPKLASDKIYNIMVRCWHLDPEQRPTFSSIRNILNSA